MRASYTVMTYSKWGGRERIKRDWRRNPEYPAEYYAPPPWDVSAHVRPDLAPRIVLLSHIIWHRGLCASMRPAAIASAFLAFSFSQ